MLRSRNHHEVYAAIGLAAAVCNRDISPHIEDDVERLLRHSSPQVRRGGCALARKVILSSLELGKKVSRQLLETLKDGTATVLMTAAASVLDCAVVYPHLFVNGIPLLFGLLDSKNNWLVIKALQALCVLLETEKRLYARLTPKLLQLADSAGVASVESEIHKHIALYFGNVGVLIGKTKDKTMSYLESSDANIRYIGLVILKHLLKPHKSLLILYKDKLLQMLSSGDKTTRLRILEIISESVHRHLTYSAAKKR
eukprot:TRINITY_DN9410_c0_g2_i1.p1 TRINITY_DN9410_c0_g2~~TRINITY_DN9410_c0_g2_i1.p1  ORF type:complete len:255 (-),score=34.59 TRINITY_DN9410_c0_g2_i1:1151-1915(-)